jgi:hypothetical protein
MPVAYVDIPAGVNDVAKQRLVRQISNTIGEARGREVEEIPPAKRDQDLQQLGSHILLGTSA